LAEIIPKHGMKSYRRLAVNVLAVADLLDPAPPNNDSPAIVFE
jgi:hypothetical protein